MRNDRTPFISMVKKSWRITKMNDFENSHRNSIKICKNW
jgi:hypothetical protein